MEKITTTEDLRQRLAGMESHSVGFVPTMGALHAGHISLVRRAREENETVVVSVFVNPTQFNDENDLKNYPRTPQADLDLLSQAGADIVFVPSVETVYPEPDTRVFDFGNLDKVMEGATRPGHFNGVGQVVSRLLNIVKPSRAYFGEKDFQQIAVIKSLVKELDIKTEIVECPIIRESDGLAMSSRNRLLSAPHRIAAPAIYAAMKEYADRPLKVGVKDTERAVIELIEKNPLLKVIYFQLVDEDTLREVEEWTDAAHVRGCIAVQAGDVRLIDNMRFV